MAQSKGDRLDQAPQKDIKPSHLLLHCLKDRDTADEVYGFTGNAKEPAIVQVAKSM